MNVKFWRKMKKSERTFESFNNACLNLNDLTKIELEYITLRFSETIKSFVFMTIEQHVKNAMRQIPREISGGTKVELHFYWGCIGNDLPMWLGEFRRKEREKQLQS